MVGLFPSFIVFQDIFRLFDKSDNVTLDGKDLFVILKERGIDVTDNQVDQVLTILNNHGRYLPTGSSQRAMNFIMQMTRWMFISFALW